MQLFFFVVGISYWITSLIDILEDILDLDSIRETVVIGLRGLAGKYILNHILMCL